MIKDIRLDDRLIHGQVLCSWIPRNSINKIVVVDDEIVEDKVRKSALKFGCPEKVSLSFHSAAKTAEILNKNGDDGYNVMILCRGPVAVWKMVEAGYKVEKITVGNMSPRGNDDVHIEGTTYASPEEVEAFKNLIKNGTKVYLQCLPKDNPKDLKPFFEKLK